MSYTTNPNIERVRYKAYCLVNYQKWSIRGAARHLGYAHNTVMRWVKEKPCYNSRGQLTIPTRSSRPKKHSKQLSSSVVSRVLELRSERRQCAEIIHYRLKQEDIRISLSSVKRILKRYNCTRYSKWKKWHQYPPKPLPEKPGILVQMDTILDSPPQERLCVYTTIDLCFRWAYATSSVRTTTHDSLKAIKQVKRKALFQINTLQTDHGSKFSKWLTKQLKAQGIKHRHSGVRKPTDNGHVERFNRTLQEGCLNHIYRSLNGWEKKIPEYIHYYNTERPHMALNYQTPIEVVRSY